MRDVRGARGLWDVRIACDVRDAIPYVRRLRARSSDPFLIFPQLTLPPGPLWPLRGRQVPGDGTVLFREPAQPCSGLTIVLSGSVQVTQSRPDVGERLQARLEDLL